MKIPETGRLIHALRRMTTGEILAYLAKNPRNHSMLLKDWGYDVHYAEEFKFTRRAYDYQFFLNQVLENFSGSFAMNGTDTIHDWLAGKYGRNLFFAMILHLLRYPDRFFILYEEN